MNTEQVIEATDDDSILTRHQGRTVKFIFRDGGIEIDRGEIPEQDIYILIETMAEFLAQRSCAGLPYTVISTNVLNVLKESRARLVSELERVKGEVEHYKQTTNIGTEGMLKGIDGLANLTAELSAVKAEKEKLESELDQKVSFDELRKKTSVDEVGDFELSRTLTAVRKIIREALAADKEEK